MTGRAEPRVAVIGAGLLGLCVAESLSRRGARVTVLDKRPAAGEGASFANGGLLHCGLVAPWNAPGIGKELALSLFRQDRAFQLRLSALPGSIRWGLQFLGAANPRSFDAASVANLKLALYTRSAMQALRSRLPLQYAQTQPGTLIVYRSPASLARGLKHLALLAPHGSSFEVLNPRQLVEKEPALADIEGELSGGAYFPEDEGGDAHLFCQRLAEALAQRGVAVRLGAAVAPLEAIAGRIAGISVDARAEPFDAVVLAAGVDSAALAARLPLRLPLRPVKGYSLTFPRGIHPHAPHVPVIDADIHVGVVPIGADRIRVAGTAELAGFDTDVERRRVDSLWNLLARTAPGCAERVDPATATAWAGLRPVSPDGMPILGRTPVRNLYLCTGHGHLGWTLAAGSGELVAQAVMGEPTSLDLKPYQLSRFGHHKDR